MLNRPKNTNTMELIDGFTEYKSHEKYRCGDGLILSYQNCLNPKTHCILHFEIRFLLDWNFAVF